MASDMNLEIFIHNSGSKVRVVACRESLTTWLELPLSTDGTACITVFLNPDDCVRIANDLRCVGEHKARVQAAMTSPPTEDTMERVR